MGYLFLSELSFSMTTVSTLFHCENIQTLI